MEPRGYSRSKFTHREIMQLFWEESHRGRVRGGPYSKPNKPKVYLGDGNYKVKKTPTLDEYDGRNFVELQSKSVL